MKALVDEVEIIGKMNAAKRYKAPITDMGELFAPFSYHSNGSLW